MTTLNFDGIALGIAAFLSIGIFHPIVIKSEYHFGTKCWWAFALAGAVSIAVSLFLSNTIIAAVLGVVGFSCFWSIFELFEQEKRVEKGWFPKNPNRIPKGQDRK